MTIYEKNMDALKEKYQIIYDALKDMDQDAVSDIVHVEDARKGGQVVVYDENGKSIYLNSKYDPENEASKYMEAAFEMPNHALLIMYGISNGCYVREYVKKSKNNTKCIVFEPNKDIFVQVILHIDISDLLCSERVCLIINGINDETFLSEIEKRLDMGNRGFSRIMSAPKYTELFQDCYVEFRNNCTDAFEKQEALTYAALSMGKKVAQNEIYNMLYLAGCRSGAELKHRFPTDMPVIIVAAGPSLEKNMSYINEAKGKAFIIVVDTAVARVMGKGIRPDAIISMDGEKPVDMFQVKGIEDVPFLAEVGTNSDVLEHVGPKDLFFMSANSGIWTKLFKNAGSEIEDIESGLSVTTEAVALAVSWGIKKIILIGADLAFTNFGADGNNSKMNLQGEDKDYIYVKGMNGDDVLTRRDYYIYLKWLENMASENMDVEFIDATEGGALKKNFINMTFRDAIDKYCNKECDVEHILSSVPKLFIGDNSRLITEALEKAKRNLRNLRKQLVSCKADCLLGKRILESGDGNIKELNRISANVDKLIKVIEGCDERALIYKWTVASELDVYQKINEEQDAIKAGICAFETNAAYFEKLGNAMPELVSIIDDCIEKLKQ
ncbi:MAG: DUF115 domain-containing protein [Clostridium sp.]|nr:DUF115 domain-containing protein [Clostridium sp.]MCM1398920.1 DUF115 domain-containing protein [Clostridium sp.]MCM1458778.1 DUF115 domain-containing protein [Bacteroides sp.]